MNLNLLLLKSQFNNKKLEYEKISLFTVKKIEYAQTREIQNKFKIIGFKH